MINITCDTCGIRLDAGNYVTKKTWGTFPTRGYVEETIHVCHSCNKTITDFVQSITFTGEEDDGS